MIERSREESARTVLQNRSRTLASCQPLFNPESKLGNYFSGETRTSTPSEYAVWSGGVVKDGQPSADESD